MESETLVKPNVVVDMSGQVCPHPLLEAKRALESMSAGQVLLLISDCPGTRNDLFSWANVTGNEVIDSETQADGATGYYLRKGKRAPIVANVTLDVSGLVCPGPVIEAKRIFGNMFPGQIMKLVSTCTSSRGEVVTWCSATGNSLLDTRESWPLTWTFLIRKG